MCFYELISGCLPVPENPGSPEKSRIMKIGPGSPEKPGICPEIPEKYE